MSYIIDFLRERKNFLLAVMLAGVLQLISTLYFKLTSPFYSMVWGLFVLHAITIYIRKEFFPMLEEKLSKAVSSVGTEYTNQVVYGTRRVGEAIRNMGEQISPQISFESIGKEAVKHMVGITLCVKTAVESDSFAEISSEIVKIGSMLNMETNIATSVMGAISNRAADAIAPVVQMEAGIEDMLPLLATGVSALGLEVGDISMTAFADKTAKNLKNMEVIMKHVKNSCQVLGIVNKNHFSIIEELNSSVVSLKEEVMWLAFVMGDNPIQFCNTVTWERVLKIKDATDNLSAKLRSINIPDIKNNQIVVESNVIILKVRDIIQQAEQIRNQKGIRPHPVGVCIYGDSHLGKTTMIPYLVTKIRVLAKERYPAFFGNAYEWQQWDVPDRDKYDEGYNGQQIVYSDDAFQDKTHEDHRKWLTFISSSPVGTVQAELTKKGCAFRAILCITTCNVLPNKSVAITAVEALHNRFPFTVHKTKNGMCVKTMREHVANTTSNDQVNCDMDSLAEMIVEEMAAKHTLYNQQIAVLTQIAMQGEILEEEEGELIPHNEVPDWAEEDDEDDEEDVHWIPAVSAAIRPPPTMVRLIVENMKDCLQRPPIVSLTQFGPWTKDLVKRGTLEPFDVGARMTPFEFLTSLGSWGVKDSRSVEWMHQFARQPFVRVESQYEGEYYIWGPHLQMGTMLLIQSPELMEYIEAAMGNVFVPLRQKARKILMDSLWSPHGRRRAARVGIRIVSLLTVGDVPLIGPLIVDTLSAVMAWDGIWRLDDIPPPPFWNHENWGRSLLCIAAAPITALQHTFDYLERTLSVMKDKIVEALLWCLEAIGVNVSGLWTAIADLGATFIVEGVILALTSALVYVIYKLFRSIFSSPDKVVMEAGATSNDTKQKARVAKGKELRTKTLKLRANWPEHSCDECEEVCQEFSDDTTWFYQEKVVDDNLLFYNPIWFQQLLGTIERVDSVITITGGKESEKRLAFSFESGGNDFRTDKNECSSISMDDWFYTNDRKKVLNVACELAGNKEEVMDFFSTLSKGLEHYKISEFNFEIKSCFEPEHRNFYMYIKLTCLRSLMKDRLNWYVSKDLKNLMEVKENINKTKITGTPLVNVMMEGGVLNTCFFKSIIDNHCVRISRIDLSIIDSESEGSWCHGIGHKNLLYCNNHLYKKGDILRFVRYADRYNGWKKYQIGIVIKEDPWRDISVVRIMTPLQVRAHFSDKSLRMPMNLNKITDGFKDLTSHLLKEEDFVKRVPSVQALNHLPVHDTTIPSRVEFSKAGFVVNWRDKVEKQGWLKVIQISTVIEFSTNGDCGGAIVGMFKDGHKLIGIHNASGANEWYGAYLTQEDLCAVNLEVCEEDPWNQLILEGKPRDLPIGPACEYLGRYSGSTMPVSDTGLSHWDRTVWHENFEELLQPGVLHALDSRLKIEVDKNQVGIPSLLMQVNKEMVSSLPLPDIELLKVIEEQLTVEMIEKMSYLEKTPEDEEELLILGLNGHPENKFVTGMELNKSAGIPWANLPSGTKKRDYIDLIDGKRIFKDGLGETLKKRVLFKLRRAKEGKRSISFSNSKLKDALVKVSAVEQGKTRVFHCIPIDKVILDNCLYGNFKEAWSRMFLKANHAVGVDPHSAQWREIYDHIAKFDDCFDLDFKCYDKFMHETIMMTAFNIINRVINKKTPDVWAQAREVLAQESISTYVIDYSTVYKTEHGNKSGEVLTTPVNCIVNEILSIYAFYKITGKQNLMDFRENVSLVVFGDDKVESVSEEYSERYNYLSVKKVMESLGHTITPGNKEGLETACCNIEQLQFLKRTFVNSEGKIVGPLLKRSIEAPFFWTQNKPWETEIWYELIKAQLYEACLHGEEYFSEFRDKFKGSCDPDLNRILAPLLTQNWKDVWKAYQELYLLK